ncbi:MAG: LamG-like jellyroll fold domain-containing protein, partial [Cyanobacteria bacterium P01_D01_bin.116]
VTVTISVNGTDNNLDFTPSNWDTYQSFTASNISTDSDISLTISGGNYSSQMKQLSVSAVNDDDVTILKLTEGGPELELTPTVSITATSDATEGNEKESGVFTISLDTPAPEGGLVIPFSVSSTATEGTDYNLYADTFTYSGESALSFDGVDDYVEVSTNQNPTDAITVEAWAKSDTTTWNSYGSLVSKRDAFILHPQQNSRDIRFYIHNGSQWYSVTYTPDSSFDITQWHHYAGTYDGVTLRFYVDGKEVNASEINAGKINLDNGVLTIGRDDGFSNRYFDGQIDEVRIWNAARSETEIQENIYQKLSGTEEGLVAYYNFDNATTIVPDVTENGNDGTPYIGQGLSFDGVDDYVDLGSSLLNDLSEFTIEGWFNAETLGSQRLDLWGQNDRVELFIDSNGDLRAWSNKTLGKTFSDVSLSENEWYHVAVVGSDSGVEVYLNGDSIGNIDNSSSNDNSSSYTAKIGAGVSSSSGKNFIGKIDEVRFWNTTRTQEEIQDNLNKKLEGSEEGLVAYYNFDDDSGTTITDLTANGNNGTLNNGDGNNLVSSNFGYTLNDWEVTKTPVVKIAEGETQATITVSKVDNETVESADETVTVTLEDWGNYEVDNNNQSATVTLNDDDEVGIEFAKLDTLGSIDNIAQEFIVSTAYDATTGTVGITLNNGNNSYTFAQGTELTFDGGAVVTVDSATTIAATGETLVNVTFTQDSATDEINVDEISEIELVNIELSSFAETDTGRIAIFDVSLAQTPTEEVTVTLTDGNGTATATVFFTTSNSDKAQSLRMILEEDNTDSSFDIQVNTTTATQQDTNYGDRTFDAPISTEIVPTSLEFYDNTLVTSEVAKIELEVTSDYANGTVGLKLDSGASSYILTAGTELSFSGGAVVTVDSDTTISTDDAGTSVPVTFIANNGSSTITTDETADIELSGEDSTTFAVRLSSQPSNTVTLNLDIGDTTEGAFASSASSETLTFTTDNWDTYQEVTVYGVDDTEDDDNVEYSIGVTASSNDSNYNQITNSITVNNLDNDEPIEEVDDTSNSSDIIASLGFVDNNGEITEGSTGQLQITLSEAAPVGGLKVRYAVSGGTATPDEDFHDLQGLVKYAYNTHENPLSQAHLGVLASEGEILKDFKLVDLDSDGDLDAVLAYDDNNLITRYYRNDGSSSFPDFEELTGTDNPFENISGESIAFGDLNGDAKQDFLLLDSNGDVFYYENTTGNTSNTPSFTLNTTPVISNSSINQITLVDINSDGNKELFASLNNRTISYYEQSNTTTPTFVENSATNPLSSSVINYSNYVTIPELVPDFVDYDGDGDFDVFIGVSAVGSNQNTIAYFENTGDINNPSFSERTGKDNPFDDFVSPSNDYYHPFLTDIDNDGDIDGFIAYESDSPEILVEYYENTFFQQVEFAEGETTQNIEITTISDNIAEYDETIEVSLSAKPSQTYTFEITQDWTVSESDANSGTIGLQIINNSEIELIGLATGTELTFEDNSGNQVVFTVDEPTTVFTDEITNNAGTIISGIIAANSNTAIMTVGERADFTDEGYRLFANLKVTSEVTETGDQIELQLDENNFSSLTLEAGTELTFSGGAIVTVTDEVTINNSSGSLVKIEFSEASEILTIGTDETTGSLVNLTSTLSIVDDDVAGITISGDTDGTTTLNTSEADAGDSNKDKTFNVVLDTKPADDKNVAVYLGVENSEEGLLSDGDETNENLVKLVFNSNNWDTSQQVTLSSVDDNIDDGDVSYNIITTVVSHDIFYHEDSVPLIVENNFDASADTFISLSIDDLSIEELEISAGTQLTFTNGTILEVANSISLSNSEAKNVNVTLIEGESISSTAIAYFQESISPDI